MKKILLSIGTAASAFVPVIAVVSCSLEEIEQEIEGKIETNRETYDFKDFRNFVQGDNDHNTKIMKIEMDIKDLMEINKINELTMKADNLNDLVVKIKIGKTVDINFVMNEIEKKIMADEFWKKDFQFD